MTGNASKFRFRFGDCEVNMAKRELSRAGQPIELQPKVFDCLAYLLTHHGRNISKQELQDNVWPDQVITEAALTQAIMKVRRAIGDSASSPKWVRTVHSRGYTFHGSIEVDRLPPRQHSLSRDTADIPPIRYTRVDNISVAYQVLGDGPFDIVYVPGWISHLEYGWAQPRVSEMLHHLASFSRLILFDKRGTGLSDRQGGASTLEDRMRDLHAVMDAVGSERAVIFGMSEGGCMSMLFAATYPERVQALALYGSYARRTTAPGYPWPPSREWCERWLARLERDWGAEAAVEGWAPTMMHDREFISWWSAYLRLGASPGAAMELTRAIFEIDVRDILSAIPSPTLVMHRVGDEIVRVEEGRYLAEKIPNAKFVELPGRDHLLYAGDTRTAVQAIADFAGAVGHPPASSACLATVVAAITDGQESATFRLLLARYRGRRAGPTSTYVFDGPTRALEFSFDVIRLVDSKAQMGIHLSECEERSEGLLGMAVDAAPNIASLSLPGQVLCTTVIADLSAGSAFQFHKQVHLKGQSLGMTLLTVARA